MKILITSCLLLTAVISINGKPVEPDSLNAKPNHLGYGMESDINNKYLWRGISYNEGLVIQPNIWITYRNFTFGVWSSVTSHDLHNYVKRNEIDIYMSHNYTLSNFDINNTLTYYNYPYQTDSPPTAEYALGISYPIGNFKLATNFTIDIAEYSGAYYVEHGIDYEKTLTKNISLTSSIYIGWASRKFNETYIGLSKLTLSIISTKLSLNYQPNGYIYLKPHIQLNRIIDKDLYEFLDKYSVYFGLLIGMEL